MQHKIKRKVVPSYPAPSFTALERLLHALTGVADEIQIDVVDGKFAPFCAWPFTEADVEAEFQKLVRYTKDFIIEIDCMIERPERFLDLFVSLGVSRVVVHLGSTDQHEAIIAHAREHNYVLGFALTNDIPLTDLTPYASEIDHVQLMGIEKIGQQGQPFDERTLARAAQLRKTYPELSIAVDGSVNSETIPRLLTAGVDRFAPGSAITRADDPAAAFQALLRMVE